MIAFAALLLAAEQPSQAGNYNDVFPAYSPDGRKVAFTSDRSGDAEIYVAQADGSGLWRLTDAPGRDAHPAWSPDGTRLAFQSPRGSGDVQIYVMNADGSDQRLLVRTSGFCGVPAWSPDATRMAFQCSASRESFGSAEAPWRIFVANVDGTDLREVSVGAGNDQVPAWLSADRLLFHSDRSGADQLHALELETGAVRALTNGPSSHHSASVSLDGRFVALLRGSATEPADVYLLERSSGALRRLTHSGPRYGQPQVSPDGAHVLFQAPTAQGTRVHVVPSRGGSPVELVFRAGD